MEIFLKLLFAFIVIIMLEKVLEKQEKTEKLYDYLITCIEENRDTKQDSHNL